MAKKEGNKNKLNHLFDYDKYTFNDFEYYGLHKDGGRIKIDNKRLKKIGIQEENNELVALANEISNKPRNTTYYVPKKIYKSDYYINWFRDQFKLFKKEWDNTLKFISSIKTPKEQGDDVRLLEMSLTGDSDDYDEIEFNAMMKTMSAIPEYNHLVMNLYTQYLHDVSIKLDALILKICSELGMNYSKDKMITRKNMSDFIRSYSKGQFEFDELPSYHETYEKFCLINNFLKHNSENLYIKVKNRYPEMIAYNNFENGDLAQNYLKIDKEFIINTINGLEKYFNEFCKYILKENLDEAKWDYDDYFIEIIRDQINSNYY